MNIEVFKTGFVQIPDNEEYKNNGKNYIQWGMQNNYPQYVKEITDENSLVQTIKNGISRYIVGNEVITDKLSDKITFNGLIKSIMSDRLLYGGCAIQVIYNPLGDIINLKHVPFERCRVGVDEKTVLVYKWWGTGRRSNAGINKAIVYPRYGYTEGVKTSEILYVNLDGYDTYPSCPIAGALKSIETSNEIQNFHYNAIKNQFAPNTIINFNNGTPTEEQKKAIDKALSETFTGTDNAGKYLVTYNESKENAVTIDRLASDDFDKRYEALDKAVRNNIFVTFQIQGILLGLPEENKGFSASEYDEAFNLFNNTIIKSYQNEVYDIFNLLNIKVEITPFSLENKTEENKEVING